MCWRPPRQETVPRTKCFEDSTLHHPPTSPVVVEHSKKWGKYKDVVSKLCFYTTVDLFDSVEMLDIVLDEKEPNYGIQKDLEHDDRLGLHQFTTLPMENGAKQSQGRKTQKMYCNIT